MTAATTRLGRLQQQLAPLPAAAKEQSGPQRRVIAAQAGDTLACIGPDGEVEWSQPIGQFAKTLTYVQLPEPVATAQEPDAPGAVPAVRVHVVSAAVSWSAVPGVTVQDSSNAQVGV